jgi:hypothetical protein
VPASWCFPRACGLRRKRILAAGRDGQGIGLFSARLHSLNSELALMKQLRQRVQQEIGALEAQGTRAQSLSRCSTAIAPIATWFAKALYDRAHQPDEARCRLSSVGERRPNRKRGHGD